MASVLEFLNNAAVAVFVALLAFILVVANDWRQRRRKKHLLTRLVDQNADLARRNLDAVQQFINALKNNVGFDPNVMRFQTAALTSHHHEVMDMMSENGNQALNGLLFWMEGINSMLDDAQQIGVTSRQLSEINASTEQRSSAANRLYQQLRMVELNLGHFIQLCEYYVDGEPHRILEFRRPVEMPTDEFRIKRRSD
jgi:hypothetical protein